LKALHNKKERNRKLLQFAVFAWAVLIAVLAWAPRMNSLADPTDPHGLNHGPLAHMAAYSLLAIMLSEVFRHRFNNRHTLISLLISGLYGTVIEFGQYLLPWRSFDPHDILMNFAAAATGALFYHFILTRLRPALS